MRTASYLYSPEHPRTSQSTISRSLSAPRCNYTTCTCAATSSSVLRSYTRFSKVALTGCELTLPLFACWTERHCTLTSRWTSTAAQLFPKTCVTLANGSIIVAKNNVRLFPGKSNSCCSRETSSTARVASGRLGGSKIQSTRETSPSCAGSLRQERLQGQNNVTFRTHGKYRARTRGLRSTSRPQVVFTLTPCMADISFSNPTFTGDDRDLGSGSGCRCSTLPPISSQPAFVHVGIASCRKNLET